jgi:hypothetical protein
VGVVVWMLDRVVGNGGLMDLLLGVVWTSRLVSVVVCVFVVGIAV